MRKLLLLITVVFVAGVACNKTTTTKTLSSPSEAPAVSASPEESAMTAAAPVQLSGKVNNHGTKTLTGMSATLDLEQDNFYFEPTFVKAEPGAHITVTLKNEGSVPHNFSIDSLNLDETVQPDKTATVTVNLSSGSAPVEFYCKFHKSQGMQGAFYFK